jgi:hypothetical protein
MRGALYDTSTDEIGRGGVPFDVEVEGSAELLRDRVSRVIAKVGVEQVLIGGEWAINRNGRRCLDGTDEIVRPEPALPLRHAIPIVPVIIDDPCFPHSFNLLIFLSRSRRPSRSKRTRLTTATGKRMSSLWSWP